MDVPRLERDQIEIMPPKDVNIDVSQDYDRLILDRTRPRWVTGTEFILTVPFVGDETMFNVRPSKGLSAGPPHGRLSSSSIGLSCQGISVSAASVKSGFEQIITNIAMYLDWLREDVDVFHSTLPTIAQDEVARRHGKALMDRQIVESLGYPIKRRKESVVTFSPPEIRRRIVPPLPPAGSEPFQPEPALSNRHYDNILSTITNMSLVMERSPTAFASMREENIRDHILVQLNAQYKGVATGETFNFGGKTDILVRVDNRNIFVAECKVWRGPRRFADTIDQILGYAAWRDNKTAICVFSRNRYFSRVLKAIPESVRAHPCYKRDCKYSLETGFRYVLRRPNDPGKELILTILAFDVPCSAKSEG